MKCILPAVLTESAEEEADMFRGFSCIPNCPLSHDLQNTTTTTNYDHEYPKEARGKKFNCYSLRFSAALRGEYLFLWKRHGVSTYINDHN